MNRNITYTRTVLGVICCLFLAVSCDRVDDGLGSSDSGKTVSFSSVLLEGGETYVDWTDGDRIGVFVDGNDKYTNIPYQSSGTGYFSSSTPIFYPSCGKSFDFIAYYPYNSQIRDYNYPLDLTQEQPDLMYSNNLSGANCSNVAERNQLQFRRVLPRVVLNINSAIEGEVLAYIQSFTKANVNLHDGSLLIDDTSTGRIPFRLRNTGAFWEYTTSVIPTPANKAKLILEVGGNTFEWLIPNTLARGFRYNYIVRISRNNTIEVYAGSAETTLPEEYYVLRPIGQSGGGTSPVTPTEPKPVGLSYTEVPLYTNGTQAPNTYMVTHFVSDNSWLNNYVGQSPMRNYTVQFNTQERYTEWVAYPLHPIYMRSGNRTDEWAPDPLVPQQYQPDLSSGWKTSGYSRGHVLPSASRNASRDLNRTTFYYTNMFAQNSKMNETTWSELENKVRDWSKNSSYDTLYVVTGAILPSAPEIISYAYDVAGRKSAIPKYLYKALLRKQKSTGNYFSIAFKMENNNTGISYINSVVPVEQIEKETGYTFFPKLPDNVEAYVKKQTSLANWN